MGAQRLWKLAAAAVLLAACETDYETCPKPGRTEACSCGGESGLRTCLPERVWGDCDCTATPTAGEGMDAAMPMSGASGAAGMAGMAGMSSGTGGTGGTGGLGGMGGMSTDASMMIDGGDAEIPELDGGEDAAGGAGGTTPEGPAYAGCSTGTVADDCRAGSSCLVSDVPFLGSETLEVCAPACTVVGDCPAAPSGGEAMLMCTGGRCRLDCSGFPLPVTCPTGMECVAMGEDTLCFDDGI